MTDIPRTKYPHMLPEERQIWHRFISPREGAYRKIVYDLHLGQGAIPPADASLQLRKVIASTSRKRVDAIGYKADSITIFEVKPRAGMSAIGQLLNYKNLFMKEHNPTVPINLAVVSARLDPDVAATMEQHGIKIYIV